MTEPSVKSLDIQFQKRFLPNLISNIIYFVVNIVIGLALVPFFLDTLGEAAYGLIPLATSLTSYVTLVIDAVNNAISRYLSIELQRCEERRANETYNTAIFGTLLIILALTPVALLIAWFAPSIFNIGTTNAFDVFLLFALVFGSVLIRTWSSNFMVTLFAYNRLDLRNYVNIFNIVVQVVVVIGLFIIIKPALPYVGISYFVAAVASLVLAYIFSVKLCPFLKISVSMFSKSRMREILGIAAWTTVSRVGGVLRGQVALIIVNILFGEIAGTEYSLVLMWSTLILGITSLVTNCFTPMVYSYRAKNDADNIIRFTSKTVKITTLITCLLVGLVCVFSAQLLTFWVGAEYAHLSFLMIFVVIPVIFSVQSSCCAPINAAYLRVRVPAFATISTGILNVILAIFLPSLFNIGVYGVAIAAGITTFMVSGLVSPIYGAYITKAPLFTFVKAALPGYGILVLFISLGLLIAQIISVNSFIGLMIAGTIVTIVYCLAITKLVLNKEEKKLIRSILPASVNNLIPEWIL